MKFNDTIEKDFCLDNLPSNKKRIIRECRDRLKEIKQSLYDLYDIENLYISEDFFKNDLNSNIKIVLEMTDKQFSSAIKNKILKKINNIELNIVTENGFYLIGEPLVIINKNSSLGKYRDNIL